MVEASTAPMHGQVWCECVCMQSAIDVMIMRPIGVQKPCAVLKLSIGKTDYVIECREVASTPTQRCVECSYSSTQPGSGWLVQTAD